MQKPHKWVHLVLPFFYSAAGIIFFSFFYRIRLIPRIISIIGMIEAVLVLAGIPQDFFEIEADHISEPLWKL